MKKIILFTLFLLLITTSLNAYSKKIVFSAFSTELNAKSSLDTFKKTEQYAKLYKLSQENDFKIYYRESGKYFVIIAEPILKLNVGVEAFALVKSEFKSAYTMIYVPKEKSVVVQEKIEKKAPIIVVTTTKVEDKNSSIKKIEITTEEKIKELKTVPTANKEINSTKVKSEKSIEKKKELTVMTETYKKKEELIDVWAVIRYVIIFFFLFVVTFYYIKFKRLYDEY